MDSLRATPAENVDVVYGNSENFEYEYLLQQTKICDEQDIDHGVCVINLSQIVQLYKQWNKYFPNIRPFYAVKCNYDHQLIKVLLSLGCGLDCSSEAELKLALSLGAKSDDIIYHHSHKLVEHLRYAEANGIMVTTADSKEELVKIKRVHPKARVLIRLRSYNKECQLPFGWKFGCTVKEACSILDFAKDIDVCITGICFHPGSGVFSANGYRTCLEHSLEVLKYAYSQGFEFSILDIGGGFPGNPEGFNMMESLAEIINGIIKSSFGEFKSIKVIAEPGQYFASSPFTIALRVMGKSSYEEEDEKGQLRKHFKYYFADGMFGVFTRRQLFGKTDPLSLKSLSTSGPLYPSIFYGPVCCEEDTICKMELPELHYGQWFYFQNAGAYSMNLNSEFNGFLKPKMCYIIKEENQLYLH